MRDYFREIDLNPAGGQPVNSPIDPRGHNDFCFMSDGQQIELAQPQPATAVPFRVFISFDCGHQQVLNQPLMLPPGVGPQIHGQLTPALPPSPGTTIFRRECCHQRGRVKVWLDPFGPQPPTGMPIVVLVSAWAKDGACG